MKRYLSYAGVLAIALLATADAAFAETGGAGLVAQYLPLGAGLAIALAALGGTLGQSKAIAAALDSIGRNPSASGKLFTPMIIGLALIESLVILSFIIAKWMVDKV